MSLRISSINKKVAKKLAHMKNKYEYEPKKDIVGVLSKKCPYFEHFDMPDCELDKSPIDSLHEKYYWINCRIVKESEATFRLCVTDEFALNINYYLKDIHDED